MDERDTIIERASTHGIDLSRDDFEWVDGWGFLLDGLDPAQWLDAMTME